MTDQSFLSSRPQLRMALLIGAWIACIFVATTRLKHARGEFSDRESTKDELRRVDGNYGHTTIDFGGQWMMGRMLVVGKGRELYHRQAQWPVAWAAYPISDEPELRRELTFPTWRRPAQYAREPDLHDAEALMFWFMGRDVDGWNDAVNLAAMPSAAAEPWAALTLGVSQQTLSMPNQVDVLNRPTIGGPLYPPIHAMLMAPFAATNDPRSAYAVMQYGTMSLTFAAGFLMSRLSVRRVWWPVAVLAILLFPGYRSGLDLGQNQVLSLTLLLAGWWLTMRGRPWLGGVVWGLLAFKPVWAASFLMVPLLLGHWRMVVAMCVTAGIWILASLPLVGMQSWFDWLTVGREASAIYDVNEKWIGLSRDLAGLIRRPLLDFQRPAEERNTTLLKLLCPAAYGAMALTTLSVLAITRTQRGIVGLRPGFLALAAYLGCYHFMYYDAVLALFPIALLLAAPRSLWGDVWTLRTETGRSFRISLPDILALVLFGLYAVENQFMYLAISGTIEFGFLGSASTNIGAMPTKAPKISADTTIYTACDTVLLLLMWAALGVKLMSVNNDPSKPVES